MSVFSSSSAELMIWCDWLVKGWITEDLSEAVFDESDKIAREDTMRKEQLEDCVADEREGGGRVGRMRIPVIDDRQHPPSRD